MIEGYILSIIRSLAVPLIPQGVYVMYVMWCDVSVANRSIVASEWRAAAAAHIHNVPLLLHTYIHGWYHLSFSSGRCNSCNYKLSWPYPITVLYTTLLYSTLLYRWTTTRWILPRFKSTKLRRSNDPDSGGHGVWFILKAWVDTCVVPGGFIVAHLPISSQVISISIPFPIPIHIHMEITWPHPWANQYDTYPTSKVVKKRVVLELHWKPNRDGLRSAFCNVTPKQRFLGCLVLSNWMDLFNFLTSSTNPIPGTPRYKTMRNIRKAVI